MSLQNLLLAVVALVIIIGGWFFLSRDNAEQEEVGNLESGDTNVSENDDEESEGPLSGSGSFAYLMGLGRNMTCDFSSVSEAGGSVAGTVYISGDKMRSDFDMEQAGTVYSSHMIRTNGTIYTWSESPMGMFAMKFAEDATDGVALGGSAGANSNVSLEQNVDYDCRPSVNEASKFVPPSDIEFKDQATFMNDMMRGAMQGAVTQ